ncbi:hypothetical protein Y032_0033g2704 [Ancylostoma ceylanicum]|uniref:Tryptophanyl-tRNA synthetase n=1 Tax=Ancylostoma ceylanicum TaxID=53326 RepID=A0A016UMA5_9BILA|nr:hypothetical protein Y032_0033g2704 [Ancylostoma ceylanicum]
MRSVRHFCKEVCQHPELYFSGIQPTGVPHLGNYFGFIEPWIQLQNSLPSTTKMILAVADQHAISLGPKPPDESLKWAIRKANYPIKSLQNNGNKTLCLSFSTDPAHKPMLTF